MPIISQPELNREVRELVKRGQELEAEGLCLGKLFLPFPHSWVLLDKMKIAPLDIS